MPSHEDQAIRSAFGLVIRSLRKEAGLSQEEFGESAGVHRTYVSMMERGIKAPTVVTLVDLSRALGMTTSELMLLFDRQFSLSLATQHDERSAARRKHHLT